MPLDILKDNAIIYVLIAWVVTIVAAKALKLQNHGFELKPYSLVYKNTDVQRVLDKILTRTRRGIRVFADVSVIAGFLMMGFAFWFLISNISAYFVRPMDFSEVTVLIPGVTLTSSSAILNFQPIIDKSIVCTSRSYTNESPAHHIAPRWSSLSR